MVRHRLQEAGANATAVKKNKRSLSKDTPLMMAEEAGMGENVDFFLSVGGASKAVFFASKMKGKKAAAVPDAAA